MKKVVYVFCGPRECFLQSSEESVGMCIEENGNAMSFG